MPFAVEHVAAARFTDRDGGHRTGEAGQRHPADQRTVHSWTSGRPGGRGPFAPAGAGISNNRIAQPGILET